MTSEQVLQIVQDARGRSSRITLTFLPEAAAQIGRLWWLVSNGEVRLDGMAVKSVMSVMESSRWGGDHDRTVSVGLLDRFDETMFANSFHQVLDSIHVSG